MHLTNIMLSKSSQTYVYYRVALIQCSKQATVIYGLEVRIVTERGTDNVLFLPFFLNFDLLILEMERE